MPPLELDAERPDWSPGERSQMMHRYEMYHGTRGSPGPVRAVPDRQQSGGLQAVPADLTQLSASTRRVEGDPSGAHERIKGLLMIHLYASIGWHEEDGEPHDADEHAFGSGWKADPRAFRSGIEASKPGMSDADGEALTAWHRRMCGNVPPHIQEGSKHHPEALEAQRARFEASIGATLPAQIYPLMQLLHAACMGWPGLVQRAMARAQALAVRPSTRSVHWDPRSTTAASREWSWC